MDNDSDCGDYLCPKCFPENSGSEPPEGRPQRLDGRPPLLDPMDLPRVPWSKIQDVLRKVVLADLTATAQGLIKEFYVTNYYDAHLNPGRDPRREGMSPDSQAQLYMVVAYEAAIAQLGFLATDSSIAMHDLSEKDEA